MTDDRQPLTTQELVRRTGRLSLRRLMLIALVAWALLVLVQLLWHPSALF
jgi:hypothetical protein